jgi:ERCC4-type nuclease
MTEKIRLIIDNREKYLITELENKKINFSTSQEEIGDIIFKKDEEIIFIIERKTVDDLKASICDGRHREQKLRLLGSGIPKERIMYIIEGNLDLYLETKISGVPVSTLLGSIINTQMRDNIKLYKTQTLIETTLYIIKLLDKFNKDIDNYFVEDNTITSSKYASSLKKSKKANMTSEVWFITQLCLIPQITEKIANEIVKKYQNIYLLMQEFERTPEHLKEKLLADITYPLNTDNKTRRIGEKNSKRIYIFLYGLNE